jgi:hypothetical protein
MLIAEENRFRERRRGDRRDSARLPTRLLVRDLGLGGSYEEAQGDLSLGGVQFRAGHEPAGTRFELRFRLPHAHRDTRTAAELVKTVHEGPRVAYHLRFTGLSTTDELALARHLSGA